MKEPNRTDLLNFLATRYNLKHYLEIGVQNPIQNFDKIICEYKVSVDPDPNAHATFCMTSDEFFLKAIADFSLLNVTNKDGGGKEQYIDRRFDLIFIDGMHTHEQVRKDFYNALSFVTENGFIVLHDCNPLKEEHTLVPRPTERGHWNGSVYKFASTVRYPKITVEIDNGITVFCNDMVKYPYSADRFVDRPDLLTWNDFDEHRIYFLNLISWDDFVEWKDLAY